MRRRGWIAYVAGRYFRSGGGARFALPAAGIAVGVTALLVVIGVMNGFQMGFIESVLELDSFHVRIDFGDGSSAGLERLAETMLGRRGVLSADPFVDIVTEATDARGRTAPLKVKVMPRAAFARDLGLARTARVREGSPPAEAEGLVLGSELADALGVGVGDELRVLAVRVSESEGVEARQVPLRVDGVYSCGYYAFDQGLAFLPEDSAGGLVEGERFTLGVKLENRFDDYRFAAAAADSLPGAAIESWREYNRSFFGALRTEKTIMMTLIGLIFLVVGVNIFHSMRKSVHARMEDIAVLKALGGGLAEIRSVFVLDGLCMGVSGAVAGLALGLFVAMNVNGVFACVEAVVNLAASALDLLSGAARQADFRVFSPDLFYMERIPSNVPFLEAFFIAASGALSAIAAAAAAAGRVAGFMPSEVLRNE